MANCCGRARGHLLLVCLFRILRHIVCMYMGGLNSVDVRKVIYTCMYRGGASGPASMALAVPKKIIHPPN